MPDNVPQIAEAIGVFDLWLPVMVSAVVVFFMSFLAWMVLPHHRNDWGKVKDEDAFMDAVRQQGLERGQYCFPSCGGDMEVMKSEAYQEKVRKGPAGFVVITGAPNMARSLGQWFAYVIMVGMFVAYLSSRALHAPGLDFMKVFQIAGAAAVMIYATALIPGAIWKGQSGSSLVKDMADSAAYGIATGLIFAALWPGA